MTYGSNQLLSGIEMIPVLIGVFAVTEVLKQTNKSDRLKAEDGIGGGKVNTTIPKLKEWLSIKWVIVRSAIIGTVVGILPGAGATIASFLCYSTETRLSKHPEKFGTGIIDGVAASETANNAATGGAMVPLLSLGIPGGNAAAVMMSALVLKGVQLGPLLLVNQPEYLSATFVSMIISNIVMVIVAIGIAKVFAQILAIPYSFLGPIIVMLAIIGSYATSMSIMDVKIMAIAGIAGILFSVLKFNSAALILGLVLGRICESNFGRAYTMSRASIITMFSSPISAILMIVCISALMYPIVAPLFKKTLPGKGRGQKA